MSLNEKGAKTGGRVDPEMSEEFEVNVRMQQGSVLSPFLFALVVDVTEFAREGALSELLYADDLVLLSETMVGLRDNFLKLKEAFEGMSLKAKSWETQGNRQQRHHTSCFF